jgi:HK97 family phage portal protein
MTQAQTRRSLVDRIRGGVSTVLGEWSERSISTKTTAADLLRQYGLLSGGGPEMAGVTETTALNLTAVWSAVRYLADSIGMLEVFVAERVSETERVKHHDHPVARFLRDPCDLCPEYTMMQTLLVSANLHGNGIALINFDGDRQPIGLRLHDPRLVTPKYLDPNELFPKSLVYEFTGLGGVDRPFGSRFAPNDVVHIRTMMLADNLKGISPIRAAARTINVARSAESYAFHLYAGGGKPPGIVRHPGELTDTAYKRFMASLERNLSRQRSDPGSVNTTPLILEDGAEWVPWSMTAEDVELLATRRFEVEEIARLYRVPPHKIGSLEKSSFNNIEQQNIDAVTDSLRPWVKQLEQELTRKLIHPGERDRFSVRIDLSEILRGDFKARTEGYKNLKAAGSITSDEIRALEGMNPHTNGMGSRPTIPVNVMPAPDADQADAMIAKIIDKGAPTSAPNQDGDNEGENTEE